MTGYQRTQTTKTKRTFKDEKLLKLISSEQRDQQDAILKQTSYQNIKKINKITFHNFPSFFMQSDKEACSAFINESCAFKNMEIYPCDPSQL